MRAPLGILALAAAGIGLALMASRASAASVQYLPVFDPNTGITDLIGIAPADAPADSGAYAEVNPIGSQITDAEYNALVAQHNAEAAPVDPFEAWGPGGPWGAASGTGDAAMTETQYTGEENLLAFLALIRQLEAGGDYQALVGGGRFSDFTDHPYKLGWPGIKRADGRRTAAAGAYQFQPATWADMKAKLGLLDFSPASQDAAAIGLLQRRGAYDDVLAGNFDRAVSKLVNEWEAFARILAGDYYMTIDQAKTYYAGQGGTFA